MAQLWPGNAMQIDILRLLIHIYVFFYVIVFWHSYLHDDYITTGLNMFRHREHERCWKQGRQLGMVVILTFKSSWIFSAIFRNSIVCDLDVDRCCDWPARDTVCGVEFGPIYAVSQHCHVHQFLFLKCWGCSTQQNIATGSSAHDHQGAK